MKKRKIFALTLIISLLFSGCMREEKKKSEDKPVRLTIWHYYNGRQKEAFDNLIEKFNQTVGAEKRIILTSESKGDVGNLEEGIISAAEKKVGSEKLPDIFATYPDTAMVLYNKGLLADLGKFITQEEKSEYNPAFLKEGEFARGELYIFPVAKATELLYLNKTDWDVFAKESGYDISCFSTWEGIKDMSEVYYEWSGGKALFGRDAAANFMLVGLNQLGEEVFKKTEKGVEAFLNGKALEKIWETYSLPYIKGYYGAFGRFRSDDLKTGDIVAAVGSTSSVAYYPKEITLESGNTYDIEVIVLPLPNFQGTKKSAIQQGAGMAVIKSEGKKEKAAAEFLKWFTSSEQNVQFCIDTGYFPVKTNENIKTDMDLALANIDISENLLFYNNISLGMDAVSNIDLYTSVPFEKGSNKRNVITKYLTEELDVFKNDYEKLVESEKSEFLKESYNKWLSGLENDLKD